jgi:hypothetical protein
MLLHETHRAGQQDYTAEADSMHDAGSAVESLLQPKYGGDIGNAARRASGSVGLQVN